MAASSVLVVEELTGQKRKVWLMGPALPLQGAEWATRQKLSTTWYQGNALEATQQVLGPEEMPSDWTGKWNTTRMVSAPSIYYPTTGAPQRITRASTMRDILDDLFLSAALLSVTWAADEGRKIVRLGRAAEWHFPHTRMDDIEWSITWAWTGRGGRVQRVATFRKDSQNVVSQKIQQELAQLVAEVTEASLLQSKKGLALSADTFSLGDLEALANAPFELMKQVSQFATQVANRIQRIGALVDKIGSLPDSLARQVRDIATNMAAVLNTFCAQASRTPPDTLTTAGSTGRVSQGLKAAMYAGAVQGQAERAAAAATALARAARASESTLKGGAAGDRAQTADMLGVHLTKQGETFSTISLAWYKNPDEGGALAKANGFPQYQVAPPPGFPLVIPNRAALAGLHQI